MLQPAESIFFGRMVEKHHSAGRRHQECNWDALARQNSVIFSKIFCNRVPEPRSESTIGPAEAPRLDGNIMKINEADEKRNSMGSDSVFFARHQRLPSGSIKYRDFFPLRALTCNYLSFS